MQLFKPFHFQQMKVLRWGITVWWKPLLIWCRLAFWEETVFLAWFPYWLLTACWYLLFSQLLKHLKTLWSQNRPFWCLMAAPGVLLYLRLKTQALLWRITLSSSWCRMGEEGIIPLFPPHLPALLAVLPFFLISPSNLPRFLWVTFTRERLGKWLAEEDVWENAPEQAITFDKAMVPVGEEEESQRVRALLVMKNAMQEGASLWSQPVKPTMYSTTDTAVVHQAFLCCCTTMSVWPRGLIWIWGTTLCLYYTSAGHQIIS